MSSEDGGPLLQTASRSSDSTVRAAYDDDGSSLRRSLSRIHDSDTSFLSSRRKSQNGVKPPQSHPIMHLEIPHMPLAVDTALAALEYLPTPLIVLSSLKTIVLANNAMGRLLGIGQEGVDDAQSTITDILKGQSLSQIGIDMISDGVPIWVSWEKFLDNIATHPDDPVETPRADSSGDAPDSDESTPRNELKGPYMDIDPRGRSSKRRSEPAQDTAVDVVLSGQSARIRSHTRAHSNQQQSSSSATHLSCRMIITIWRLNNERYFTLTFTTSNVKNKQAGRPRYAPRATSSASSRSQHSQISTSSPQPSITSSTVTSPSEVSTFGSTASASNSGVFFKCSQSSTVTELQKVMRMKDAMLNAMQIPVIAMWRDESVVFPNKAARRLFAENPDPTSDESYDFMSRFRPWTADFSRELSGDENPIVKLCRTKAGFSRWQIGLINSHSGKKSCYDVSGQPIFDDRTGEFFAGMVAFKDVTEYTERIANQATENEQQFQLICDTMPQMLWTTRSDGYHTWFSKRWYDYTGMTPEQCVGLNWVLPFHSEDLPAAGKRWMHSLATGDEYLTEYRCLRKDGVWRWMLGRALPLKDPKTGQILKWFGTCTDIQDIVDARDLSQRARRQLVDVLKYAQMSMWTINKEGLLTFFEGESMYVINPDGDKDAAIGKHVTDLFISRVDRKEWNRLTSKILEGRSAMEIMEVQDEHDRYFRVRLMPQKGPDGSEEIIGIIGTTSEVTVLKLKEQENIKLLANESAAKEASKMKSSFLANMSHEIRTPIAGVLGMSELLMDTPLDTEQMDFAQNIQRSANSLLTVINDILDFSKIESGRLDIEEVQFSLPVVLRDVAKMLSYAAARKDLAFTTDIQLGSAQDLPLLGDPGRIRQILTNLLTNSIKFTSEGYVKLSARVLENQGDSMVIEFTVEDSGIGIEEEVRKRLFRPFSQADSSTARRFGGTGLGLTISKNLVDLMHGSIWLESKLDQGTNAGFRIPFKKPEFSNGAVPQLVEIGAIPDRIHSEISLSTDGRRISPPLPASPARNCILGSALGNTTSADAASKSHTSVARDKIHILIVEDNPVNQQIALKFIKGLKFTASAVWNGKEALQYLLRATSSELPAEEKVKYPLPSVIFMDCQMPVLDGYHATHILRHHEPYNSIEAIKQIPIIAMTASAIQGDREKCERAGMDDYLAKPVKKPVLENMILKWINDYAKPHDRIVDEPLRPALSRSGTDHSSSCMDIDRIANEILGQSSTGGVSGVPRAALERTREQRRSSLSKNILASEIPGLETEDQRGNRRALAEEKATALRDAKLLAATEPITAPEADISKGLEVARKSLLADGLTQIESHLTRSYLSQGNSDTTTGVMALTEANIEILNNAASSPGVNMLGRELRQEEGSDYFATPGRTSPPEPINESPSPGKTTNNVFPVTNIPGPPPEVAVTPGGLRVLSVEDIPQDTRSSGRPPPQVSTNTRAVPASPVSQRNNASLKRTASEGVKKSNGIHPPSLKMLGRKQSDWSGSHSTIRPGPSITRQGSSGDTNWSSSKKSS